MSAKPIRSLITTFMNVLVIVAVLVAVGMVIEFFGALSAQVWGQAVVRVADILTVPFGVVAIKTGYGGVFDVNAGLTVLVLLLAEWALSAVRIRA